MTTTRPIKVLVAKPGLDGHDRGAKVIARSLRDAGMEVVYTGIFRTPESILRALVQEDAQALGLSSLSGAHVEYAEELLETMKSTGLSKSVLFILGGVIPDHDAARLREMGVAAVFGPGTRTESVISFIRDNVPEPDQDEDQDPVRASRP